MKTMYFSRVTSADGILDDYKSDDYTKVIRRVKHICRGYWHQFTKPCRYSIESMNSMGEDEFLPEETGGINAKGIMYNDDYSD